MLPWWLHRRAREAPPVEVSETDPDQGEPEADTGGPQVDVTPTRAATGYWRGNRFTGEDW